MHTMDRLFFYRSIADGENSRQRVSQPGTPMGTKGWRTAARCRIMAMATPTVSCFKGILRRPLIMLQ